MSGENEKINVNVSNNDKASPKNKYTQEIQSMMYTFGDVRNGNPQTAFLVESLIHSHLVEILVRSSSIAHKRASRSLSSDDMLFLIRHDGVKKRRLIEFGGWKDLRKNAKPVDESTATAVATIVGTDAEEEDCLMAGGDSLKTTNKNANKNKKPLFPWDHISNLVCEATDGFINDFDDEEGLESESLLESLRRLQQADQLTKHMSREEYLEYSECRQASFTFKKAKKFRDWLNPKAWIDYRVNDEVVEVLGFLAWEQVRKITELGLMVKNDMESNASGAIEGSEEREREDGLLNELSGLFGGPKERTPLLPEHVYRAAVMLRDAFWQSPMRPLINGQFRSRPFFT